MEKIAPRFAGRHLITLEDFTKEVVLANLRSPSSKATQQARLNPLTFHSNPLR